MDAVKSFNAELSSLYDVKPPISKAKMNSLTRGAIKAIKFYKHVVQSVEKFIQKCKPEYKVPGLYVIDSIVRQSRHQFGLEKDVFAPRFAKNMQATFLNLLKCPPEDKSKIIRVLNLWQKNSVFPPEVIQPLFDLVDPNHPIHKEQSNGVLNASINNLSVMSVASKTSPSTAKSTPKDKVLFTNAKPIDPAWLAQTKLETANIVNANKLLGQVGTNQMDVSFLDQLQHLQQLLLKKQEAANEVQPSVKFDKKLLDFDYGEEEDEDVGAGTSPAVTNAINQHNAAVSTNNLESLGLLLTNPEVLRQLQTLQAQLQTQQALQQQQQSIQNLQSNDLEEKMRRMQQQLKQHEDLDKHITPQTIPMVPLQNAPFPIDTDLKPADLLKQAPPPPPPPPPQVLYVPPLPPVMVPTDISQPPPGYHPPAMPFMTQQPQQIIRPPTATITLPGTPIEENHGTPNSNQKRENSVEIVHSESGRSRSRSVDRARRRSTSRSPRRRGGRDRDRRTRSKTRSRSRSRSRSRTRRKRSRSRDKRYDRDDKYSEEEREKRNERRKKGLPNIVKEKMSVCTTTLWVGHISKLVQQEELSDTFGEVGDVVSIDLISPRGCAFICMNRRQDAFKVLTKLKNFKLQGKAITLAWAPGKGVKGKEWKDYWEQDIGVSYIPWSKLTNITDEELDLLEEGGMIDEDSLPPHLRDRRSSADSKKAGLTSMHPGGMNTLVNMSESSNQSGSTQLLDTSQPPPLRSATNSNPLLAPNQMQMMPPGFAMPPGMLGPMGMQMPPGMMPNVPIGVPPPNMQSLMGPPSLMPQMLPQQVNPPFSNIGMLPQLPLGTPTPPSDKPNNAGMPAIGVPPPTEPGLANLMRQQFGVGPPLPMQQMQPQSNDQSQQNMLNQNQQQQSQYQNQQSHPEDMDMDMDLDEVPMQIMPNKDMKPPSLSDQLLAQMKNNERMNENDNRDYRNRDRGRDSRDRGFRDRMDDRNRDRGRGRDRGGNRDRRRSRDRDNRDNNRDRDREDRRDRDRDGRNMRNSPPRNSQEAMGVQSEGPKPDGPPPLLPAPPKQSLADRLRQLADGTLPLIDDRDRDGRNRNDRGDRPPFDDNSGRRPAVEPHPRDMPPRDIPPRDIPPRDMPPRDGPPRDLPPNNEMAIPPRRPGDGPISLMDIPTGFPLGPRGPMTGPGGPISGPGGPMSGPGGPMSGPGGPIQGPGGPIPGPGGPMPGPGGPMSGPGGPMPGPGGPMPGPGGPMPGPVGPMPGPGGPMSGPGGPMSGPGGPMSGSGGQDRGPGGDFGPQNFPRGPDMGGPMDRGGFRGGPQPGQMPMDDFMPDRRMHGNRFMPDDFDRMGGPSGSGRRDDFDRRGGMPRGHSDDLDRNRFDFEMRHPRDMFDGRGSMPDDFMNRDMPPGDFDPRRGDYFMDSNFGPMNRGPRGMPMMGGPEFEGRNRGRPGNGPMFGNRNMDRGRSGMRGGMRSFGPRGGFDPRDNEPFYQGFDDNRGGSSFGRGDRHSMHMSDGPNPWNRGPMDSNGPPVPPMWKAKDGNDLPGRNEGFEGPMWNINEGPPFDGPNRRLHDRPDTPNRKDRGNKLENENSHRRDRSPRKDRRSSRENHRSHRSRSSDKDRDKRGKRSRWGTDPSNPEKSEGPKSGDPNQESSGGENLVNWEKEGEPSNQNNINSEPKESNEHNPEISNSENACQPNMSSLPQEEFNEFHLHSNPINESAPLNEVNQPMEFHEDSEIPQEFHLPPDENPTLNFDHPREFNSQSNLESHRVQEPLSYQNTNLPADTNPNDFFDIEPNITSNEEPVITPSGNGQTHHEMQESKEPHFEEPQETPCISNASKSDVENQTITEESVAES